MITSTTPLKVILSSLPDFIMEMQPDWEMCSDYVLSQVSALTVAEWAEVAKVYDACMEEV
tara:strand:- start:10748 stop:10927 length:180 start_codon:yes stop_codon:yes gene_type:complete